MREKGGNYQTAKRNTLAYFFTVWHWSPRTLIRKRKTDPDIQKMVWHSQLGLHVLLLKTIAQNTSIRDGGSITLRRASLVVQWLRICLPMQGTWVRALVWEDPTCHGATGPMSHNYWACASGACAPNKRGRDSERPAHRDEEWPPLATTRENPRTETKTQHSNQSTNQSINQ